MELSSSHKRRFPRFGHAHERPGFGGLGKDGQVGGSLGYEGQQDGVCGHAPCWTDILESCNGLQRGKGKPVAESGEAADGRMERVSLRKAPG